MRGADGAPDYFARTSCGLRVGRPTSPRHSGPRVVAFTLRALLDGLHGARSPALATDEVCTARLNSRWPCARQSR